MLQGSGASFMFGLAVGSIPMMSMAVYGSVNCFEKPGPPPPTGGISAGGGEIACSSTSTSTSATSRSIGSRRRMGMSGDNNVNGGRGKTYPSVMLVKEILPSLVLR
ncbi:hypothetical protein HAX54_041846 [Datura stramonium]|uniref:Uncharacterized protein n=1 Tax=Datura stramonium TaxID=4076 RepID=A0ABS8W048_DATST|nr:hypothetical protein [Datura stramonium]